MSRCRRAASAGLALLLVASAPAGQPPPEAWVTRYDGPASWTDVAEAVVVSPGGDRDYVTGVSTQRPARCDEHGYRFSWAYATIAYDAGTGEEIWVDRYRGPGRGADHANDLALSPDGGALYVTGGSGGEGTGKDYATVAYEAATGARLWVSRYDGPTSGLDSARSVAVAADGARVFVPGWSADGETASGSRNLDHATIAYDARTGEELWVARYAGPTGRDHAFEVDVDPDARTVFVTG